MVSKHSKAKRKGKLLEKNCFLNKTICTKYKTLAQFFAHFQTKILVSEFHAFSNFINFFYFEKTPFSEYLFCNDDFFCFGKWTILIRIYCFFLIQVLYELLSSNSKSLKTNIKRICLFLSRAFYKFGKKLAKRNTCKKLLFFQMEASVVF